ncbi:helicase-associated domain-containing protein [Aestuariimicrobium ganziense]|uniref:helicase-associated domain-containing protein n=1 Tax=Aestuariimicrobium ganziense TaxID=2773677 RepID=UPI00194122CB|nr:helicase-associated domain-containing protein [Aestuariimicrobium ganziense]
MIRGLDAEALTALLRARPDLAHPRPSSTGEVAERATSPASVRLALEGLDRWQRRVATGAAAFDTISVRHLAALLEADRGAVARAVAALRARALLWGPDTKLRLVSAARIALGPHPAGLAPDSPTPLSSDQVATLLAEVDDEERAVLDRLTWDCPVGRVSNATRTLDLAQAQSPVERLLARRLLRPSDDDHVVLPREVSLAVREGRLFQQRVDDRPPDWPVGTSSPLAEDAGLGTAVHLAATAVLLADELGAMAPRPLATGGISRRDQATLAEVVGDAGLAELLVALLGRLRLITSSASAWLPTTRFDTWAAADGFSRWASLVEAWVELADHDRIRRAGVDELRSAPAGMVVDAATLTERVLWRHPHLAVDEVARVATAVLQDADRLGLSALGVRTSLWEATEDPGFPAAGTQFLVQSDLTAVSPGPLTLEVARTLALVTERESPGPASVHRFTPASVRRALDAGWSVEQLRVWLDEHSSTTLPQPLAYLLDDVARQHGRIRVRATSSVVRVDDEAVAEALVRHPRAAELGVVRLAPTVLASDAEPEELVLALRELGHAPIAEGRTGEPLHRPPARRLPTPGVAPRPSTPSTDQLRALVNTLHAGQGASRAQADLVEVLASGQRDASWLDLDYVDDQGRQRSATVRVLTLAGGQVRLVRRGAGQLVVPVSRVVRAQPIG